MIKAYCKDSVTFKTATHDQWGTATYVSSTVKCRFEFKTKLVRNLQGEQVVSSANVLLPLMTVTHDDRVTYGGKEYSILVIGEMKDFSGKFLQLFLA